MEKRSIQLPNFEVAWTTFRTQPDFRAFRCAVDAVLAAHDDTCIECHNADQRPRCPKRQRLAEIMDGEPSI